ncbi:MAG: hypothetical protein MI921_15415 [Cytophagales bacterium]|nr:hypothetical protein [Cytophagales bacterium]
MNRCFQGDDQTNKGMKNAPLAMLCVTFLFFTTIELCAQDKEWGLGLRIGNPTGITAKKYLGTGNALEVALGTNFNNGGFELLAHYLFHFPVSGAPGLDWYYGFGGQLQSHDRGDRDWDNDMELGADGVIGLEYIFADAPVAIFLDGMLFLEIIDDPFDFDLDASIGVRYVF